MLLFAYNSCEDSYYAKAKTWERWWKSASHLSNTDLKWILRKTSFICKCLIQLSLIMTFLSQARWVVRVLCTVRYNLTHLTLRKASWFVSGCSGNMQNRKLIFSHCFTHLWDSIKPVLSAHLLITGVVCPVNGPSTSILSTRQTQSIIDFSKGFSSEYLLLLHLLKYSLVCIPTDTNLFIIYCSTSQPSYKLGKSNMKKKQNSGAHKIWNAGYKVAERKIHIPHGHLRVHRTEIKETDWLYFKKRWKAAHW